MPKLRKKNDNRNQDDRKDPSDAFQKDNSVLESKTTKFVAKQSCI